MLFCVSQAAATPEPPLHRRIAQQQLVTGHQPQTKIICHSLILNFMINGTDKLLEGTRHPGAPGYTPGIDIPRNKAFVVAGRRRTVLRSQSDPRPSLTSATVPLQAPAPQPPSPASPFAAA